MPDLLAFAAPPPLAPPGASPLLAVILLAINVAQSTSALGHWWQEHQPALKRLAPAERALATAAKDAAKARLAASLQAILTRSTAPPAQAGGAVVVSGRPCVSNVPESTAGSRQSLADGCIAARPQQ